MAAEVDFGDQELFEQLDADEAPPALATQRPLHTRFEETDEEAEELRERLRECEEQVRALQAENGELKRKLKMLTRPSGLTVDDSKLEGPLLQILFMNNTITKQCHHEVEDFISSLVQRYEEQQRAESDKTTFNVKPQPSSFILEEDHNVGTTNTSKKIKEAFSVVGSVLYFANFCLDKLGQPILNENPQLTDGWEIPKYQQVFTQILSLEGQEIQVKPKRPKAHCFNCGSEDHQMKDCLQPRNAARISEKRKQFLDACGEAGNQNFQQRYHADEVEERFGRFKPGIISDELQDALGVTEKTLPPFIYRMRQLGYPPGWLKEAEMEKSGLTLYDGKASPGDESDKEEHYQQNQNITYDTSKLINYPGFNISTPSGVADEWRLFGSVPLQPSQQKELFAHYLSTYHSATLKSSSKRHSSHQSSHHSKRHKGTNAEVPVADMEMDSDIEIPQSSPSHDGFQFQPPLPPGSPQIPTPPPLPRGTPPCTPPSFTPPHPPACTPSPLPRDTPPLTPSSNSPARRAEGSAVDEDTLTLEELEEQHRLIWAALEQADSANSDSDFPAGTPLTGNSVASSPTRMESDVVLEEKACQNLDESEPGPPGNSDQTTKAGEPEKKQVSGDELVFEKKHIPLEELVSEEKQVSGDELVSEKKQIPAEELVSEKMQISVDELIDLTEEPELKQVFTGELVDLTEDDVPSHADSEGTVENWPSTSECGLHHSKDLSDTPVVASFSAPSKNASPVPDMSKFAAGITPFEFENMAESTGVYLRIRKVLKNSPRNQQRNKNASV